MGTENAETTACYTLALSEEDLRHSDQLYAKLSPSLAANDLDLYVEQADAHNALGDKLGTPTATTEVATYSYCALRQDDPSQVDSCRRKMHAGRSAVLRVAVVPRPGHESVPFSLVFQNFGPSCKFPVAAELNG